MSKRRSDLRPALAVSGGLHLLILIALLISWRLAPPLATPLQVVAVNIVSDAQVANVKAAVRAPERQSAAEPEPAPPSPEPPAPVEAPAPPAPAPPPPAPAPQPKPRPRPAPPPPAPTPAPAPSKAVRPTPPKPKPIPKPTPKPPPPRPDLDLESLDKPTPKHASKALDLSQLSKAQASHDQSLDLSALSASPGKGRTPSHDALDLTSLAAGGRRASAAHGAARAETDRSAHAAIGAATALDASSLSAMQAKLYRYWHPNCDVEGATGVIVKVRIRLSASNALVGTPTVLSQSSSGADAGVVEASAQRAQTAVAQAAPFTELPKNAPKDIVLKFNAKEACSG